MKVAEVITKVYTISNGEQHMKTRLQRIGNSKGILIPSAILKTMKLEVGATLEVELEANAIIVKKVEQYNPLSLKELFSEYKGDYRPNIVISEDVGAEVW